MSNTPARLFSSVARAAFALLLLGPVTASALVDGTPPALWHKHTAQGDSAIIGNTVLASNSGGVVNDIVLGSQFTISTLSSAPADGQLVAAYAFWSGSLRQGGLADSSATVQFAPGVTQPVGAEQCQTLGQTSTGGTSTAYYCRADITTQLKAYLNQVPSSPRTINNDYNITDFDVEPGHPDVATIDGPGCTDFSDPCQAAYGGWSMIFVWSSPSASAVRDVAIFDGFLRMDEICTPDGSGGPGSNDGCIGGGSSGVSPAIALSGFNASNRNALFSVFALEGDQRLGSPPERAENADFFKFNGAEISDIGAGTNPKNFYNSVISTRNPGGQAFSGVDIKTFSVQLPNLSGFPPKVTSVNVQPGSGDGIPDVGDRWLDANPQRRAVSNGELFFLGALMLQVDSLAPSFRNSTKKVDKTTAAPGDTLTYAIHVENNGTLPANVLIKDALPTNVDYVAGSTTLDGAPVADAAGTSALFGAGISGGQLWPIGGIPGLKQFADVTFKVRIKAAFAGGDICNTGEIDANYTVPGSGPVTLPPLPVKTNPCTTVSRPNIRQPQKTVTTASGTTSVKPGDRLRYRITLPNTGSQGATGLTLTDDLPKFVKLVAGSIIAPSGATATSTPTGGANGTGTVTVSNITIPGAFSVDVFFEADILDDAAFAAAGGVDGSAVSNRAHLAGPSVDATLADSDDPTTALPNDPTTVFVRFGVDLSTSSKTVTGDAGGFVSPGQTLTWTVRFTNTGAKAATATINDDLPAFLTNCRVVTGPLACSAGGANGSGRITGSGITVGAGASLDVKFTADVVPTAADGTQLTNVALLTAAERAGVTWQARAPTITVKSQVALSSTLTVFDVNGGGIEPGDDLIYTITLKNSGNRTSGAATIKDVLDANLTFVSASDGGSLVGGTLVWNATSTPALAALAANATVTVTFRARINATVPNNTTISSQAFSATPEANTPSDDPNTAAANDPTLVRVIAAPSFVDSTKTVVDENGAPVRPGDLLDWKIDVKNTGRALGTGIVVSDTIDPSLDVVSISNGGTQAGGVVTWNIAQLLPGQANPTLTVVTRVKTPLVNGTTISNQANVRSAEATTPVVTDDPATAAIDDATSVKVTSSVALTASTKTVVDNNGGEALPGDTLTWKIRVIATGDAIAQDVTILDPIDRCLSTISPANNGLFDGARIRWDKTTTPALALVAPGTPVEVTFTSTITAGTPDGTVCANQGALASPSVIAPPSTNTDNPATPVLNDPTSVVVVSKPVLTASTKVAQLIEDANSDGQPSPGDKIRYTITVSNTGSDTAKGVTVSDTLSPLLTNAVLSTGGTLAGPIASWTLGDIAALTNKIVTIDVLVQKPLDDGTTVDNQATLRATNIPLPALTDDPSTTVANDPTRLVLKSAPKLSSTKTVTDLNGGRIEPTDIVRYTIKLKNTGTSLARAVKLQDVLDPNLAFVAATGGTFDSATRTVTFTSGTLDLTTELTFTLDAKIAAGLDNGTPIDNQGKASSTEVIVPQLSDDPATAAANDPTRILVISAADLTTSTKTFASRTRWRRTSPRCCRWSRAPR
jgi:uncharacterized repeat protein (TIGR01451 family)